MFCVPDDVDAFKAFAKKRGLRLSQKSVLVYTGDDRSTIAMVNKWAISGEMPLAFGFFQPKVSRLSTENSTQHHPNLRISIAMTHFKRQICDMTKMGIDIFGLPEQA